MCWKCKYLEQKEIQDNYRKYQNRIWMSGRLRRQRLKTGNVLNEAGDQIEDDLFTHSLDCTHRMN